MLYVFIVPTGTTLNLDMNLAVKKVLELKTEICQLVRIAVEDQVLLCSGGEELMSENIVGNYSGAGTDTNPIFLFSRKEFSLPLSEKTSIDLAIENKVTACRTMIPSINSLQIRRSIAQQLAELSLKGKAECFELVHQQHLQQQGWAAVIANLEDAKDCLIKRKQHLDEIFENFLSNRSYYQETIKMFPDDIALLAQVPVLSKLLVLNESECSVDDLSTEHTLLTWFCSEPQQVLESLVEKCQQSLDNLDEKLLFLHSTSTAVIEELERLLSTKFTEPKEIGKRLFQNIACIIEQAESPDYREVKGIEKRLASLNHISETTGKLCKDQNELMNTLESSDRVNQAKDPNVLQDVCTWYQNQLELMLKNYIPIGDMLQKCKAAKLELCTAINRLIPCICKLESDIYNLQCNIEFYEKHVKSVINKIESFHQVHLAPQRYLKTLAEVCRRKEYSSHFLKWATELSEKASKLYEKEVSLRKSFSSVESKNMVDNLFNGMDDMPPPYAVDLPHPFDQHLPDIKKEDLERMKSLFPHLAHLCEVTPPDSAHLSQSDSAISSNIPSSLKIVSHIFENNDFSLSEKGLSKNADNNEFVNEVFSFTSSNASDIENKTRRTRTSSLISFAAEAILEEKHSLSVEFDEEFETVDHYGTSPVEINQRRRHYRPTSSSDIGVHRGHLKVTRARSDGDAISPVQERLKSSDSMDFQSTEYYIDDSMPSSYSESNATSPLMRGNRMVKSHHVVVAELQRQLEEKSAALASTSSSLESSHSNVVKVHAKLSTLQKFIREMQGSLQTDLSHLKEFVREELTDRMTDASEVVEKINSCVKMMQRQMVLEKEAAVAEAKKDFVSIENAYRHRLEVESQKLNDAENQISHYEEHLQAFSSSLEEKKHEIEQLVGDLQDKKELLKRIMLEHELEFDSFKIQTKDTIQEKDSTIAELQQNLTEALSELTKLKQEKVDAQSDYNKNLETKQAMIYELQENKRSLKDEISRLQGLIDPSKDLLEVERKLKLTLLEKEECMQDAEKKLNEFREDAENYRQSSLKELEQKYILQHKNEIESLCSRFRMVVSATSIEHPTSSPEPPIDETFAGLEDLRKEVAENRSRYDSEKERVEKLHQEMVDNLNQEITKLEEEKNKAITSLQTEHEEAMERLKSRITAESQVSFNEAINSLAKEKDDVIEDLKSQVTALEAKIASIKFHLQKYLPSKEIRRDTMSQSHSSSSWGKVDLQRTEESILLNKLRLVFESLLQQGDSVSANQQQSFQSIAAHESVKKRTKPKEDSQRVQHEYFPRYSSFCIECSYRISIFTCNEGELVLIRYDKKHENYVIFHFGPHTHFLHSDSFPVMNLKLPLETAEGTTEDLSKLILAVVVTKEFCITKKKENRYKVTQGTKFYRVKVKPWDKDAALERHQFHISHQMTATMYGTRPLQGYQRPSDERSSDMSQSSI